MPMEMERGALADVINCPSLSTSWRPILGKDDQTYMSQSLTSRGLELRGT